MCQWLLDEDVMSGLECGDGDRFVKPIRRRDDYRVDRVVDDESLVGLVGRRVERLGEPATLCVDEIRAGNDIRTEILKAPGVEGPHPAEPDDTNPDLRTGHV